MSSAPVVPLLLAAAAAGCNAFSSVFQRKANRDEPTGGSFGPRALWHLMTRPIWLLGGVSMIASFLLQAVALRLGTLSAVEPVLVVELPLTLILGAWLLHHPLRPRDWGTAAAMAGGLALFIAVIAPSGGDAAHISEPLAAGYTAATAAGVAILVVLAQLGPSRARAALFGAAAGSGFGLVASLLKIIVAHLSDGGFGALFTTWETYGLIVCGPGSVLLVQLALRSGTLVAAQPGITLLDPTVSLLWGLGVLGEHARTGPVLFLAAFGGVVIVLSVVVLARSSALHIGSGPSEPDGGSDSQASAPRGAGR